MNQYTGGPVQLQPHIPQGDLERIRQARTSTPRWWNVLWTTSVPLLVLISVGSGFLSIQNIGPPTWVLLSVNAGTVVALLLILGFSRHWAPWVKHADRLTQAASGRVLAENIQVVRDEFGIDITEAVLYEVLESDRPVTFEAISCLTGSKGLFTATGSGSRIDRIYVHEAIRG